MLNVGIVDKTQSSGEVQTEQSKTQRTEPEKLLISIYFNPRFRFSGQETKLATRKIINP